MTKFAQVSKSLSCGLLCASAGLMMSLPAHAASTLTKGQLQDVKASAKANYEAAIKTCDSYSGNAEDVCKAKAKLDLTTATAIGEARFKGTPKAAFDARNDIADAKFKLAKEMCDDKGGNDKDVCVKEAKASHVRDKSEADVRLKTRELINEAAEERVEARYAVAKEKCDALAGDAKDACIDKAKKDYGM